VFACNLLLLHTVASGNSLISSHLTLSCNAYFLAHFRGHSNYQIGLNRRHRLPNRHHFLTYLSKTSYPVRFGSSLSWHCQFVYEKLINDAKNNLCQNLLSCILSPETNTNNKNLHQIGVTTYLSSTVNTDLNLEMTIIILRRHCL